MVLAYQRRLFSNPQAREDISRGMLEPIAREFDVTVDQLVSRDRSQPLCDARLVAVGALQRFGPAALGRLLHRDCSTIIAAERSLGRRPDLEAIVASVR